MKISLLTYGNESSIEIVKSLAPLNFCNIQGYHWDTLNAGMYYLNNQYIHAIPNLENIGALKDRVNKILLDSDWVFITNDKLMKFIYDHYISFIQSNKFLIPPKESLKYCLFKDKLYDLLPDICPKIYTSLDAIYNRIEYPYISKPKYGSSSEGIVKCSKYQPDLDTEQNIICEYLPGDEFTVDVFCDLNGKLIDFNVRQRVRIREGISAVGSSTNKYYDEVSSLLKNITAAIKLPYIWFAQFKLDKNNVLKLMEINCRVSGSFCVTKAARKDYIKDMCILLQDWILEPEDFPLKVNEDIITVRHFNTLNIKQKSYVFDLDGTLCTETGGLYHEAKPIWQNIDIVNKLYQSGAKITIFSARGMKRFNNDVAQVYSNLYEMTKRQLDFWQVKYDCLILGKPVGIYVDIDAVNKLEDLK